MFSRSVLSNCQQPFLREDNCGPQLSIKAQTNIRKLFRTDPLPKIKVSTHLEGRTGGSQQVRICLELKGRDQTAVVLLTTLGFLFKIADTT